MKNKKMILWLLAVLACVGLLSGCKGKTETKSVPVADILAAVQKAYGEDYIPSMDYDAQILSDLFGVKEDMVEEYVAQGPMISVQIDTFVAVRAKAGKADAVEQALKDYQKGQLDAAAQYPMNLAKANASEVVRYGDYVFFVMLGTPSMEAEEKGEEAALESAKENNKIALDAIAACFEG